MEYEKMLEKAIKELPQSVMVAQRFEIPKVMGHIQGNKTIIVNFNQIASAIGRPVEHLLKYITKELATRGDIKGNQLVLWSKLPASRINDKIQQYAAEYVLCRECGKPDTKLVKEKEVFYMRCTACGAKYPIRGRI
ncbi:translation initiation factor IF-2 subunit beta [Candidatus Woesearchaeota archaeon]|nr:translation initiation factor IF-2 subunit beta [Candidatus Woesearchaeota archaeon]